LDNPSNSNLGNIDNVSIFVGQIGKLYHLFAFEIIFGQ